MTTEKLTLKGGGLRINLIKFMFWWYIIMITITLIFKVYICSLGSLVSWKTNVIELNSLSSSIFQILCLDNCKHLHHGIFRLETIVDNYLQVSGKIVASIKWWKLFSCISLTLTYKPHKLVNFKDNKTRKYLITDNFLDNTIFGKARAHVAHVVLGSP